MRQFFLALLSVVLLFERAPQINSAPKNEIRFALIGAPREVNVWALFDEQGASYADYALRFEYFPRLYHLAPPDFSFAPSAAQGLPSSVSRAGEFYAATVNLRPDLKWTDGSRFTAEDVAFTVNTALAFDLGFDWRASYSRGSLDRVEVVNPYTVKFIFKQKPNVGDWQYGALQGVIVQKKFWQTRITQAEEALPTPTIIAEIEKTRARLAQVQYDVDDLTAKLRAVRETGAEGRDIEIPLTKRKLELGYAKNNYNKALSAYDSALKTAHQALYDLDDKNEPTLGAWIFESKTKNTWINKVNPAFPFGKPNFARASYHFFDNEKDALAAYEKNEVDFILSPNGLTRSIEGAKTNPSSSARFLVFNPAMPQFADHAFRAALSCMIDRQHLAENILRHQAAPLDGLIVSAQWRSAAEHDPCAGMDSARRVAYAVKLLKESGYSWTRKPDSKNAGKNLTAPNGKAFPKIILSAPSKKADALRYAAAKYIAEQAQYLGIPFSVKELSADEVVYAVYSSKKYDAALLGWRLGEYPRYLCGWFDGQTPSLYSGEKFAAKCNALAGETNLDAAKKSAWQIESELLSELSFIPLFIMTRVEAYQNISYPAANILNGWSGLYGAPSYAMPAP